MHLTGIALQSTMKTNTNQESCEPDGTGLKCSAGAATHGSTTWEKQHTRAHKPCHLAIVFTGTCLLYTSDAADE